MLVQPALASAHESRYVDGFAVSFSLQVSNRVDVAAPALAGRAAPRVISGATSRTAPATTVARDKFFFILPSFFWTPLRNSMSGCEVDLPST
jgi:hypothetical protein